jgi:hypothetical protein
MSKRTKVPAKKSVRKAKKAVVTQTETTTAKEQRNGISRPGEGTACRAIWDTCDALNEVRFRRTRSLKALNEDTHRLHCRRGCPA